MGGQRRQRSWKNLVLDREYQLLFTLFMVVTCALFMSGLGWFVLRELDTATKLAIQDVQGQPLIDEAIARQTIESIEARRDFLVVLLAAVGVALVGGLFVYGIKMTHHVAGPLYKIGTYCDKVAAGKFDRVYALRKGDQLVSFYEHFKQAHEVLRLRHERDIECLRAVVAAADQAELAGRSEELGDRLRDVRELLATKEAGRG
jgi:hypothetical protein